MGQDFLLSIFFFYFFSSHSTIGFIVGIIFGFLYNAWGIKRVIYSSLVGITISIVYNLFYQFIFNPYFFTNFVYIKNSYFLMQILAFVLVFLLSSYLGIFVKHILRKEIVSSIQASSQTQKRASSQTNYYLAKKLIIVIALILFGIAGFFVYKRVLYIKQIYDQQNRLQVEHKSPEEQFDEEIKKIENDDRKYLSQKIATIFTIGGNVLSENKGVYPESASVEFYIPKINKWQKAPSLQTARAYASAVATLDKIYVFGGSLLSSSETPLASVEEFDPNTNIWSYKSPMPEGRSLASTIYLNGKVYLIGGQGNSFKKLNSVLIYDHKVDKWSQGPPIPDNVVTEAPLCGAIGQKIYCLKITEDGYTFILDTTTNTWEKKGTENRSQASIGGGATTKEKIISVASRPQEETYLVIYNFLTDSYEKLFTGTYGSGKEKVNFPKVFNAFGVVGLDDYLLVIGGDTSSGPRKEVYAINTAYLRRWFSLNSLNIARENMAIAVLPILLGENKGIYVTISGTIFSDTNKNFRLDLGEITTPNVKVKLIGTKTYYTGEGKNRKSSEDFGNTLAVTFTDNQGKYTFTNVAAGKYQVAVENPHRIGELRIISQYLSDGKIIQSIELQAGQMINDYNFNILEFPIKE